MAELPRDQQDDADKALPLAQAVPDLELLLELAFQGALLFDSPLHGEEHWLAVARAGLELARREPDADPAVLFLFAVLHDTCRLDEGYDLEHGPAAARKAKALSKRAFRLSDGQQELLEEALQGHSETRVDPDPTVGACFDSDRLDFWRLGARPDPRLLSTASARSEELIEWARGLHDAALDWSGLQAGFSALEPGRLPLAAAPARPDLPPLGAPSPSDWDRVFGEPDLRD